MNSERLDLWKQRLSKNEGAYSEELDKMDHREDMYKGTYTLADMTNRSGDAHSGQAAKYVYNALAETIEAQVSNDIPMPKVTARRKQDEHLAEIIENMLRNELDRLPFERVNDISERVVPIQGAGMYLIEWDNTKRTHNTVGEVAVSFVHPKRFIPQDGIYDIEDMDYFILKTPTTKEAVKARYGVDVAEESESEPEVKTAGGGKTAEDMVTQYTAYYRNENGGIGKYSWVNDTELEDLEDYQARRLTRCASCGAVQPLVGEVITDGIEEPVVWAEGGACPVCGGHEWKETEEEYEEVIGPIQRSDGTVIDAGEGTESPDSYAADPYAMEPNAAEGAIQADGERPGLRDLSGTKLKIPYYKPDLPPVVLQRNVSVYGRLMGESDADKLEPLQNSLNRVEQKIMDRLLKAGDRITLPDDTNIRTDPNDDRVWRVGNLADLNLIRYFQFTGDITQPMAQVNAIYQQMRQTIGVTDSFQGRKDTSATSGTAKQFSAAQAAGRLESKRVQKEAAYAELFERMFKFILAYADEPRPVVYQDGHGNTVYGEFRKWDFLEKDEAGQFWWNDQFLFACDTTAPLASNRERLWQETTAFFQSGAFGNPDQPETLLEYWRKMELLHYPGAAETRANIQERVEAQQAQAAMEQQAAADEAALAQGMGQPPVPDAQVEEMARQAAMEDMAAQMGM